LDPTTLNAKKLAMSDIRIDDVFFAQTHVLRPGAPFFKLVGSKDTLIKVQVVSPSHAAAPDVIAELSLDGDTTQLSLEGPDQLPAEFCGEPGKVVHRFDDSFTATIPGKWIKRGLAVTIHAGGIEHVVEDLEIGPPLVIKMNVLDIHYFDYEDADYPQGWEEEIEVRRPFTELHVQRKKRILFPELVIPARAGLPAVRCTCTDDYMTKTGEPFNGKQGAALQWQGALQAAGGQHRLSIFYISIANVPSGGEAWDFGGVGSLSRFPVLNHEMGHVLGVDDLPCEGGYPYRGPMYGNDKDGGFHGGPTWGFDPRIGLPGAPDGKPLFVSPVLSENAVRGTPGQWKKDPMGGGGIGEEPEEEIARFSDYSVRKMQEYMEAHIAVWDEQKQAYGKWSHWTGRFDQYLKHDGFTLPIENDVEVFSVMAACSAVTEEANFIYEIVGPYISGLIDTFDPANEDDRRRARRLPVPGWDLSLRITQGGTTKTCMLPMAWRPDDDPLHPSSLQTRAINVPTRDGKVTHAQLLLTPEAHVNGLPDNPTVLYERDFD
jgi:hypothetical protein